MGIFDWPTRPTGVVMLLGATLLAYKHGEEERLRRMRQLLP